MSFDLVAPHYRWMEFLLAGEKLQRCRTAFLEEVATAHNVLILGEGHGRFLVECRRRLPNAQITCVDASERMLAVAHARLDQAGLSTRHVAFIQADALRWDAPKAVADLVVTHFFLDCFRADQLGLVIAKLAAAAQPNASWLLADFQAPESGLARFRARLILKSMYAFFRVVTRLPANRLTPPDDFLRSQGFKLIDHRRSDWGLLRSDLWKR